MDQFYNQPKAVEEDAAAATRLQILLDLTWSFDCLDLLFLEQRYRFGFPLGTHVLGSDAHDRHADDLQNPPGERARKLLIVDPAEHQVDQVDGGRKVETCLRPRNDHPQVNRSVRKEKRDRESLVALCRFLAVRCDAHPASEFIKNASVMKKL